MFISFHFLSTNCLELGLEMYRCVNFLNEELLSLRNNGCQKCMKRHHTPLRRVLAMTHCKGVALYEIIWQLQL